MDRHLVTVEVSVESCTDERVKLDCLSFDKFRLECLDTQPVQCWSTVKEDRMSFKNILQDIPNNRVLPVNYLLG